MNGRRSAFAGTTIVIEPSRWDPAATVCSQNPQRATAADLLRSGDNPQRMLFMCEEIPV